MFPFIFDTFNSDNAAALVLILVLLISGFIIWVFENIDG